MVVRGITAGTVPQQRLQSVPGSHCTYAHRRLTEVLKAAKHVPFDDSARIVFFSDCHRGDNSRADGFVRNKGLFIHALTHYRQKGFTYIEVGDGDELWKNRQFGAVRRAHGRIFDLLHQFDREQRLQLIVGNHEIQGNRHDQVEKDGMAAHEGLILQHARTGQRIFCVHGHQADFKSDRLHIVGRFGARHIWRRLQLLGVGSPPSHAHNSQNRIRIQQRVVEWLQANRQVVICGHTHHPSFAAHGEPPYFNTGSCLYAGYITGLEIWDGKIVPVRWSVRNRAGQIRREVMAPPRKLRVVGQYDSWR